LQAEQYLSIGEEPFLCEGCRFGKECKKLVMLKEGTLVAPFGGEHKDGNKKLEAGHFLGLDRLFNVVFGQQKD